MDKVITVCLLILNINSLIRNIYKRNICENIKLMKLLNSPVLFLP